MSIILNGSAGETFPTWTTAGRPSTPNQGQTGYNTTINTLETYDGSAWTPTGANPTITQTIYTSGSGTYTVPTGVKWLRIRMCGSGGGGGGSGSAGNDGGDTLFGGILTAGKGLGGLNGGGPRAGGTATGGDINIQGGNGGSRLNSGPAPGYPGGANPLGPGGCGGEQNGGGGGNATGYGGGGGCFGTTSGTPTSYGSGSAGAYLEKIISSPSATYTYTVGGAGTGGTNGGNGSAGVIIIEEHYNW